MVLNVHLSYLNGPIFLFLWYNYWIYHISSLYYSLYRIGIKDIGTLYIIFKL